MEQHIEIVKPADIERKSFEIIASELENRGISLPKSTESIVKRVIHTTADFDFAENLVFSASAIETAHKILLGGNAIIVTDTEMAKSGINKRALAALGADCQCFMKDSDVAQAAAAHGTTRATASVEKAARLFGKNSENVIFACGNAPTALIELHRLANAGIFAPALVIGVPVGFVNVVQSKELILRSPIPHIVARGRKGGSTVAAAICNALLYECQTIKANAHG